MKKTNIINLSLLVIMVMLVFSSKTFAASQIKLVLDGKDVTSSAAPIIEKGRTLVPIRFIAEEMGANVHWNGKDRVVTIEKDKKIVILYRSEQVFYRSK